MGLFLQLLAAGTVQALMLASIGFLVRTYISKKIAEDGVILQANLDRSLEILRSEAHRHAARDEIRFSRSHERMTNAMCDIYSKLIDATWATETCLSPYEFPGDPAREVKLESAYRVLKELMILIARNKIYFPSDVVSNLDGLTSRIGALLLKFQRDVMNNPLGSQPVIENAERRRETWHSTWNEVSKELPKTIELVEGQFRALLGSHDLIQGD